MAILIIMADEKQYIEDQPIVDETYINNKLELQERISNMSEEERGMLYKIIQYNTVTELLSAMKNLKKTSKEEWKNILTRLNIIKGISFKDKSGKDFNDILKKLIPAVGILAGTLLSMRESEQKESIASEPSEENNPLNDKEFANEIDFASKSIILNYCKNNENGFSF